MIEGVEILHATVITAWHTWTCVVAVVVPLVTWLIVSILYEDCGFGFFIGIAVFLLCLLIFGVFGVGLYETGKYEYKVIIDDSVSMNDFLDKYEIIDQEGKIYIVREREHCTNNE